MSKKSAPKAPNPFATAAAQTQANTAAVRESARINAVDQYGPLGSTTYLRGADGVPYAQRVTLDPTAQTTLANRMELGATLSGKARMMAGQVPLDAFNPQTLPARQDNVAPTALSEYAPDTLPALPGLDDFGAAAARAEDAAYGKAMSLMRPDMQAGRAQLVQSLSDRGIPLDSAAGRAELDRMDRAQSEATSRAAYDAVTAGGREQSRLFGLASSARGQLYSEGIGTAGFNNQVAGDRFNQAMQAGGFANQARRDALAEALALRSQPLTEIAALDAATGAVQVPGFQGNPGYAVEAADISGLVNADYQNRLAAYKQRQQGLWGTLGTLGRAALS